MNSLKQNIQAMFILLVTNFTYITFAANPTTTQSNLSKMLGNIFGMIDILAPALGIMLMIIAIVKLKKNADNPNNPKNVTSSIVITFIASALCFNYQISLDLFVKSTLGESSAYCSAFNETSSACFDQNASELMKPLEEFLDEKGTNGTHKKELIEKAKNILEILQIAAIVYFIKNIYELKKKSEGASQKDYPEIIFVLIACALVADLPHTIEMMTETLKYIGFIK